MVFDVPAGAAPGSTVTIQVPPERHYHDEPRTRVGAIAGAVWRALPYVLEGAVPRLKRVLGSMLASVDDDDEADDGDGGVPTAARPPPRNGWLYADAPEESVTLPFLPLFFRACAAPRHGPGRSSAARVRAR